MDIVQEFTEWRKTQNFSLRQAASQINVSCGALCEIEKGQRKTPVHTLGKMVARLQSWNAQQKMTGRSSQNHGTL